MFVIKLQELNRKVYIVTKRVVTTESVEEKLKIGGKLIHMVPVWKFLLHAGTGE